MRVTDPQALKALAHPVRLDLIELLCVLGSATAATCARHLGDSQASCSFHLRQLARYGFVEQAVGTGDRRERPWRLTDPEQSWGADSEPAGAEVSRVRVQREADRMLRWKASSASEPERWRTAAFLGGASLPVTADELDDIARQLRAVLETYVPRLTDPAQRPDGARFVRLFLAATPLTFADPRKPPDEATPAGEDTPTADAESTSGAEPAGHATPAGDAAPADGADLSGRATSTGATAPTDHAPPPAPEGDRS